MRKPVTGSMISSAVWSAAVVSGARRNRAGPVPSHGRRGRRGAYALHAMQLPFSTPPYRPAAESWPKTGQVILAHYDETSVIVYQAYRPAIGLPAARANKFCDGWSRTR